MNNLEVTYNQGIRTYVRADCAIDSCILKDLNKPERKRQNEKAY